MFSREALPGVRSSGPTLEASLPFIRQARLLVRPSELRGTARQLRLQIPNFVTLSQRSVPLLGQARALSSCTNTVLVPFANSRVPDPDERQQNNQKPLTQANRGFVGLAGESRVNDGNLSYFRTSAVAPPLNVRPGGSLRRRQPAAAAAPDVACETQEKPNLNAPGGSILQFPTGGQRRHRRGPCATRRRRSTARSSLKAALAVAQAAEERRAPRAAEEVRRRASKKLAEESKP